MRILTISDVHADATTNGVRRFEEIERSVEEAADAAIRERVDVFVFAGDLADPESGPILVKCIELIARVTVRLERAGIRVILIAGNHDVIDSGDGWTTIDPLRALVDRRQRIHVVTQATSIVMQVEGVAEADHPAIEFACMPYTSLAATYDPIAFVDSLGTRRIQCVVVSHLNVRGVTPGEESLEMPRGREVWLPDEPLAALARVRPVLVLQGHYHRRQVHVTPSGLPVHIVGSVGVFSHGEEEHVPGYMIVTV
jgi:predicted phosphodiesterase